MGQRTIKNKDRRADFCTVEHCPLRTTSKHPQKVIPWGNSILFLNLKYWNCAYCGKLIKDKKRFSIVAIDGNPSPYILCSKECLKILVVKLEAGRFDSKNAMDQANKQPPRKE